MLMHLKRTALALTLVSALGTHPAVAQSAVAASASTAGPASYSLLSQRDPELTLTGPFRFHPGDDPRWSNPAFNDANWPLIPGGQSWDQAGYKGLRGVAWYRFELILPAGKSPFALYLPAIDDACEVYVNGRLSLTAGKLPPHPSAYHTLPTLLDLPTNDGSAPRSVAVALRIWGDPNAGTALHPGLTGQIRVGRSDLLQTQASAADGTRRWAATGWIIMPVLFLISSIISFFLYLVGRDADATGSAFGYAVSGLWYAILCLGQAGFYLLSWWQFLHSVPVYSFHLGTTLFYGLYLIASTQFYWALLIPGWKTRPSLPFLGACLWIAISLGTGKVPWLPLPLEAITQFALLALIHLSFLLFVLRQAQKRCVEARIYLLPMLLWFGTMLADQWVSVLALLGRASAGSLASSLGTTVPVPLRYEDIAAILFLLTAPIIPAYRFRNMRSHAEHFAAELEAARTVQQVVVPENLPNIPGLALDMAYLPAEEVGGDFFQILPLRSGDTLIVIGDVSGKGLPAALTVSLVVGTLRTLSDYADSAAEILTGLNRRLYGRSAGFTTCLILRFSADCTTLKLVNAGHLPPYLNGREMHTEGNLPLGLDPQAVFAEATYLLTAGDHLTVLTDGVPEAMHNRELFGFDRTHQLSDQSAASIAEAARSFGQSDDITVLTIDVLATVAEPQLLRTA